MAATDAASAANAAFGRPWSSAEDAALKAAVDRYQTSWKVMVQDPSVSQVLQGRTPSALRNRWQVLTNGASLRESRRELKEARSAAEQAPPSFPPTASSVQDAAQLQAQWNYQYMLAQQAQRRKQQQRRKRTRDSDEEESSSSEEDDESDLAEDTDSEGEGGSKKKRKLPDGSKGKSQEDKEGFLFYYQNRDSLFDVCETGQVPTKTLKELLETTFGFGEPKTLSLLRELGVTPDPYERKEKISKALFDHFSIGANRQITLYPIQTASAAIARPRSRPRPSRPSRPPGVLASGAGALPASSSAATYASLPPGVLTPAAVAALMNTPGRPNYFPSHYSLGRPSPGPVATTLELTDHQEEPQRVIANPNAFGGDARNAMVRSRNNYKCGRCGQPKRGHKCMM